MHGIVTKELFVVERKAFQGLYIWALSSNVDIYQAPVNAYHTSVPCLAGRFIYDHLANHIVGVQDNDGTMYQGMPTCG